MVQQIVTLTGVYTEQGNKNGRSWTRYDCKDAGGNKYQTFDEGLGKKAQGLVNQSVTVTFHEEARGQYTNNVLDGIEAAGIIVEDAPTVQAYTPHPANVTQEDKSASIARAVAFKGAIELAAAGVLDADAATVLAVAEGFEGYLLNGADSVPDNIKF